MKILRGLFYSFSPMKCLGIAQASMTMSKALVKVSCHLEPFVQFQHTELFVQLLRKYTVEILNPAGPWIDQSNGSFHRVGAFLYVFGKVILMGG